MKLLHLKKAIAEARRFIVAADNLEFLATDAATTHNDLTYYTPPIPRGAVRRASMDLTRALADLRRPE